LAHHLLQSLADIQMGDSRRLAPWEDSQMENQSGPPRQPSMAAMIAGTVLWFVMWVWAIMGTLYVLIGVLYFAVDPDGHYISIQGDTTRDKLVNMAGAGALGAVGIIFLCLRRLGYWRFGDRSR
jgi:hypothetical protein